MFGETNFERKLREKLRKKPRKMSSLTNVGWEDVQDLLGKTGRRCVRYDARREFTQTSTDLTDNDWNEAFREVWDSRKSVVLGTKLKSGAEDHFKMPRNISTPSEFIEEFRKAIVLANSTSSQVHPMVPNPTTTAPEASSGGQVGSASPNTPGLAEPVVETSPAGLLGSAEQGVPNPTTTAPEASSGGQSNAPGERSVTFGPKLQKVLNDQNLLQHELIMGPLHDILSDNDEAEESEEERKGEREKEPNGEHEGEHKEELEDDPEDTDMADILDEQNRLLGQIVDAFSKKNEAFMDLLRKERATYKRELATMKKELLKEQEEKLQLKQELKKTKQTLADEREAHKQVTQQPEEELTKAKQELDGTKQELEKTKQELEKTKQELEKTKQELEKTKQELETKRADYVKIQQKLTKERATHDERMKDLELAFTKAKLAFTKAKQELESTLAKTKKDLEKTKQDLEETKQELKETKEDLDGAMEAYANVQTKFETEYEAHVAVKQQLKEMDLDLADMSSRLAISDKENRRLAGELVGRK